MFVRLLAESLRRGSRRKLLALLSVLLGTLAATALGEVLLASGDRLAAELASYGANIEVVPAPGAETLAEGDLVNLRHIFWSNNIVAVAPLLTLRVRLGRGAGGVVAPLVGTWFEHPLGDDFTTGLPRSRPTLAVAGRWPRDGAAEVAVGRRLAARLGVVAGQEVNAALGGEARRLAVVGIVGGGGEE
jgi:putative ABC transport system permease protein